MCSWLFQTMSRRSNLIGHGNRFSGLHLAFSDKSKIDKRACVANVSCFVKPLFTVAVSMEGCALGHNTKYFSYCGLMSKFEKL